MLLPGLSTPEPLSKELHSHPIPLWIALFPEDPVRSRCWADSPA